MESSVSDLDRLHEVFEAHRQEWLDEGHEGDWAVVTDDGAHGFYGTYEDAYLAAANAFGDGAFLLQQVLPEDRIESVQHVRFRLGRELAKEHPAEADLVLPIPDSGNYAALGTARSRTFPSRWA